MHPLQLRGHGRRFGTTEGTWRALHRCGDQEPVSVHATRFPVGSRRDRLPAWEQVMHLRTQAHHALELVRGEGELTDPLDAGLMLPSPAPALDLQDVANFLGVSWVRFGPGGTVTVVDLRDQPRCERSRRRDPSVTQRADGSWLSDRDADVLGLA